MTGDEAIRVVERTMAERGIPRDDDAAFERIQAELMSTAEPIRATAHVAARDHGLARLLGLDVLP